MDPKDFVRSTEFKTLMSSLRGTLTLMDELQSRHSTVGQAIDELYLRERGYHPDAKRVLAHLNSRAGRKFRETDHVLSIISTCLRLDGIDAQQVLVMINRQCASWKGTHMEEYLRPDTLFSTQHFENYYATRNTPTQGAKSVRRGPNI